MSTINKDVEQPGDVSRINADTGVTNIMQLGMYNDLRLRDLTAMVDKSSVDDATKAQWMDQLHYAASLDGTNDPLTEAIRGLNVIIIRGEIQNHKAHKDLSDKIEANEGLLLAVTDQDDISEAIERHIFKYHKTDVDEKSKENARKMPTTWKEMLWSIAVNYPQGILLIGLVAIYKYGPQIIELIAKFGAGE